MSRFVETETDGPLGIVTIDRPNKLNALSTTVMEQLRDGFRDLEASVDVVILQTTGDVFSAGADLKEIDGSDVATFEAFQTNSVQTYRAIQSHSTPTIAAVDGMAYGGGFALAASTNMIVAADDAEFALPEVQLGLVPAGGGVIRRLAANVGVNKATELLTTGESLTAEAARRHGLVNQLSSPSETLDTARELAESVAQNPTPAVRTNADIADKSLEMSSAALSAMELESSLRLFCYDEPKERISAFVRNQ